MPWIATGEDGGEVAVDRDQGSFLTVLHGTMVQSTPEDAVNDFVSYVDDVRQQLLDAGEDPSEHLLTVSMDGENWMFMSEFQHNDNGNRLLMNGFHAWKATPQS